MPRRVPLDHETADRVQEPQSHRADLYLALAPASFTGVPSPSLTWLLFHGAAPKKQRSPGHGRPVPRLPASCSSLQWAAPTQAPCAPRPAPSLPTAGLS